MEARRSGKNMESNLSTTHSEADEPHPQSEAEKAETARRLNPHSRSQLKLDEASKRPAGMTPVPQKKSKPTKWQFGIRSRNQPLEAIGCIYRALQKLGAEWVIDEDWEPPEGASRTDDKLVFYPCSTYLLTTFRTKGGSFISDDGGSGASLHHTDSMSNKEGSGRKPRFDVVDPTSHYRLPADPWVIRVRWKKDGMYPPGTVPPGSTHSSSIDLRRQSIASLSSAGGSLPEVSSPPKHANVDPKDSVIMHVDIQLYEMEPGVYLVDFKCAGYETPEGMLHEEKDVTSPFPFLDLASKLIIQLAEAD